MFKGKVHFPMLWLNVLVITKSTGADRPEQTVDPDEMPQSVASDQGLLSLPLVQQFLFTSYFWLLFIVFGAITLTGSKMSSNVRKRTFSLVHPTNSNQLAHRLVRVVLIP